MNVRRTLATAGRVLDQIRHDPRTVVLLLLVPSLLIGLVSWLFSATTVFEQIGPAMLAIFPFIVMFAVASVATLRERRSGTLERLLTLPVAKLDFVLGYTLAFSLIAIVQAGIAVGYAAWVCGLVIKGNIVLLLAVAVTDGILGTTLGLFASAFARTEFQVVQFMPVFVFPQILLGGIFLPRSQLPDVLHAVSNWLPLSHAVDALNAVAGNTESSGWIAGQLGFIGAFAIAAVVIGSITLRRRTE